MGLFIEAAARSVAPSRRVALVWIGAAGLIGCTRTSGGAESAAPAPGADLKPLERDLDVPYVPTPQVVVDRMIALAQPKAGELLMDLGCGDGRIVNTALANTPGLRGVGVDIDPERIAEARAGAKDAGVADRAEFRQQDLFQTDISKADVLTMYLLPDVNIRLRPTIFETMRPGARVVSHDFHMGDWQTERQETVEGEGSTIYFWVVPAAFGGAYDLGGGGAMRLAQRFQIVTGEGRDAKGAFTVEGRAEGATLRLVRRRSGGGDETLTLTQTANGLSGDGMSATRTAATPTALDDAT